MTELGEVTVIAATHLALLCQFHDLDKQPRLWVPKTVLLDDSEVGREFDRGILCVKAWFGRQVYQKHPPAILCKP